MINIGTFNPTETAFKCFACDIDQDRTVYVTAHKLGNETQLCIMVEAKLSLNPPPLMITLEGAECLYDTLTTMFNALEVVELKLEQVE